MKTPTSLIPIIDYRQVYTTYVRWIERGWKFLSWSLFILSILLGLSSIVGRIPVYPGIPIAVIGLLLTILGYIIPSARTKYLNLFAGKIALRVMKPLNKHLRDLRNSLEEKWIEWLTRNPPLRQKFLVNSRNDHDIVLLSANAFVKTEVEPSTIHDCIKELQGTLGNKRNNLKRIVACSSLKPKEWINQTLIRYLLTTLAVRAKAMRPDAEIVAKRFFILPPGMTEDDDEVMETLKMIHESVGFEFNKLDQKDPVLKPIIQYQTNSDVKEKDLDPAFLFLDWGDEDPWFYRIRFPDESYYRKEWKKVTWFAGNSDAIAYYASITLLTERP
ncbi:MAG: hypothetical protein IIA60_06590 [Candidatus Marinimicrobia bacterium]|nr:hypothetical protein [Candidatus Neomarinimicrobiota bacterium]